MEYIDTQFPFVSAEGPFSLLVPFHEAFIPVQEVTGPSRTACRLMIGVEGEKAAPLFRVCWGKTRLPCTDVAIGGRKKSLAILR